jgi:hypothetical protein
MKLTTVDRGTIADRISPNCNQHLQRFIGALCHHILMQNNYDFLA